MKQNLKPSACELTISTLLLSFFLVAGCKSEKPSELVNIDVATALKQSGKFSLTEIVSDVKVIQLDTVRDAYFGNMNSLSMTDHFFGFVCDMQKRAYLFDRSGKFITNIGRRGKGPGEYSEPNVLAISPNEQYIVIGDPWQGKLLLFDIAGHFIREKVIKKDSPGWRFEVVKFADKTSIYVVFRRPVKASPGYASILKYDLDFNLTLKILPRPGTDEEAGEVNHYYTLIPSAESTCFWEAGKDTVYYIDRNGTARPGYHLDIKNHCFDQEKGQMKLYVPGQIDFCTKAISLVDLPGYLFATVVDNGGSRTLVYDKQSHSAFGPDRLIACDTSTSESWIKTSIDNDLYGLEPLFFHEYFPERQELIALVRPGWAIETHNMTCIRQRTVKFPQIRDQLVTLAESRLGWENMAIVVMKLR
jgi:hypothetical protein